MQSNLLHMTIAIIGFIAANLVFIVALRYYRKSGGAGLIKIPTAVRNSLLRDNFIKLCFMFASLYFTAFIVYNHTGIACEDIEQAAQCECYALQVVKHKDVKQKLHWANNGLRMCPDSKFFSSTLEKYTLDKR